MFKKKEVKSTKNIVVLDKEVLKKVIGGAVVRTTKPISQGGNCGEHAI